MNWKLIWDLFLLGLCFFTLFFGIFALLKGATTKTPKKSKKEFYGDA